MKVSRRRANLDDLDVVLDLVNLAYKHEERWKVEPRTSASELSRLLPDQNVHPETLNYQCLLLLIADEYEDISLLPEIAKKSRIVGHIRAVVEGDNAFFGMFAVWPSLQGLGIGRKMLQELTLEIADTDARASRAPTTNLSAEVSSENPHLFPMYEKLGFKLTGKDYPIPSKWGPLQPGFTHEAVLLRNISRDLSPFL